jgi:phosphosulfolactate phosphohydrolase-like enzyme
MASCRIISAVSEVVSMRTGELPVLIDTLRAASTIVVGFVNGVKRVIPMREEQQPQDFDSRDVLTIGESGGKQLPGFEAGNSPSQIVNILKSNPRDTIAMRTSNLIRLLNELDQAVICSSINVQAVASYCGGRNICIIGAGASWGQAEDLSVALALGAFMGGAAFDPVGLACFIRESGSARHLQSLGFQDDVDFVADSAQYAVVPVYDGKEIRNVEPRP